VSRYQESFHRHWINPEDADPEGLVGVGGNLSPSILLRAYREGVFPWYSEGDPILWWSPDPRAIFELDRFHISKRLARTLRSGKFQVTLNYDFPSVIRGCADRPLEGTWITPEVMDAYIRLHRLGFAHSVESWIDGELAGGVYGVAVGGLFAAESMFYLKTDGSKVALAGLVSRLRERGYELMDTQMVTEHTVRLGAIEISRGEYLSRLRKAIARTDLSFI
jgi:leucyl/phenylalanyl-tRNA---protein transferase